MRIYLFSAYFSKDRIMSHKSLIACKSSPNIKIGSEDNEQCNSSQRIFRNLSNDPLCSPLVMNPHKALFNLYRRFSVKRTSSNVNQFALIKKNLKNLEDIYNYSNKENTFTVKIHKRNQLIGLSISGGKDASRKDPFCQLIRIWNLHPSQPALECGKLALGDIILEVNGTSMIGLTYNEALKVLRDVACDVELKIIRPHKCCVPSSASCKENVCSGDNCSSNSANSAVSRAQNISCDADMGELKITLLKRDGCLGFSICHEDNTKNTTGGIYVKSLTREHAIAEGRIKPGDKILQVNGIDVSRFSHTEALTCLRNAPDLVTLKLYRHKEGTSCCQKHPLPKVHTFNVILEKCRNAALGFRVWDTNHGISNSFTNVLPCAAEIIQVFPGSLADKNGIKLGDRILEVNGESLIGKTADEVNYVLRNANSVIRMVFCRIKQDEVISD